MLKAAASAEFSGPYKQVMAYVCMYVCKLLKDLKLIKIGHLILYSKLCYSQILCTNILSFSKEEIQP